MSARSLSLKNPALIAVVLVLLAAVTVLNIRTFGTGRKKHSAGTARAQAYPVLPGDLNELVRLAGEDLRNERPDVDTAASVPSRPRRDPFRDAKQAVKSSSRVMGPRTHTTRARQKEPAPPCAAVLVGGPRPLALIGGRTLGLGDRTGDATIVEIGTGGVVLQDENGRRRILRVGEAAVAGSFSIRVGGTDPLAEVEPERKEP